MRFWQLKVSWFQEDNKHPEDQKMLKFNFFLFILDLTHEKLQLEQQLRGHIDIGEYKEFPLCERKRLIKTDLAVYRETLKMRIREVEILAGEQDTLCNGKSLTIDNVNFIFIVFFCRVRRATTENVELFSYRSAFRRRT